jgi:hypothetical protein
MNEEGYLSSIFDILNSFLHRSLVGEFPTRVSIRRNILGLGFSDRDMVRDRVQRYLSSTFDTPNGRISYQGKNFLPANPNPNPQLNPSHRSLVGEFLTRIRDCYTNTNPNPMTTTFTLTLPKHLILALTLTLTLTLT